jgi:hypothetical protein
MIEEYDLVQIEMSTVLAEMLLIDTVVESQASASCKASNTLYTRRIL